MRRGVIDLSQEVIDGSFFPAAGGGEEVSPGYKGKGSLIDLLVDGNGQPLATTTTAANGASSTNWNL